LKFNQKEHLKALKEMRHSRGLTQKEVETRLNLRKMAIFDYENGRIKLPIEIAVMLCNLYKCDLSTLYSVK